MAQTNDPNLTPTGTDNGRRSRPMSGEARDGSGEQRRDSEGTPLVEIRKSVNENGMKNV